MAAKKKAAEQKTATANATQLAKILGISLNSLRKHREAGNIPAPNSARQYPLFATINQYCGHLREAASGRQDEAEHKAVKIDKDAAESRLKLAQAQKAELEYEILSGKYLKASEVESTWSDIIIGLRAAMLSVPSKIGTRIPGLSRAEIATIEQVLRDEMQAASEDNPNAMTDDEKEEAQEDDQLHTE